MSCCCTKIYKFCKPVNGCNAESFGALFSGLADGDYTIQLDFLNSVQMFTISVADSVVTFTSTVVLNENYTYTGQVIDTPIVVGEVSYDCFQFTTTGFESYDQPPAHPEGMYIEDVIEGDNISIDKSNPKKPKISAIGFGDVTKTYVDEQDAALQGGIDGKVDKIDGYGLSEESYTTVEKSKLASITEIFTTALKNAYDTTVNWVTTNGSNLLAHLTRSDNPHGVTKSQVGLSNVDNTSDANKPVSDATNTALAAKANDNAVIHTTGNESASGIKTFTTSIGLNNTNPRAPIHVGNSSLTNSSDSQILISRNVDDSVAGNGHSYSDSSTIDRAGGIAYNSFDARNIFTGANSYDHYAAYQVGTALNTTGTITNNYGYVTNPAISAGTLVNNYGAYIGRIAVSGSGSVTNDYGIYINSPVAGTAKNYSIYSYGTAPSFFGGALNSVGGLYTGAESHAPVKTIEAFTSSGTEAALRLYQSGQNYWDWKIPASSSSFVLANTSGDWLTFLANGNAGFGTSSPSTPVHIIKTSEQFRLGYDASKYVSFTTNSAGNLILSSIGNKYQLGTGSYLNVISNYAGTGEIPAGTFIGGDGTNSNFAFAPNPSAGASGSKFALVYFNGSAWKSALEYVNTTGATPTNLLLVKSGGMVGIGKTPTATLDVSGDIKGTQYKLSALNTAPSSSTDTGSLGEIRVTSTYIYICTATNTWVRSALSTW